MSWFIAGKEVVKDLGRFLLPQAKVSLQIAAKPSSIPLPPPPTPLTIAAPNPPLIGLTRPEVLYVGKIQSKVWQRPVVAEDSVIGHLIYGQPVSVLAYEGRFAKIDSKGFVGYVLKDELETIKGALYPTFHEGEIYTANHPDTKKLRRLINDEFANGELFAHLQPSEFVSYRLSEKNQTIPWGQERPRVVGTWHSLLRGKTGINISVTPKTGALMEFQKEDGTGWLGYTKAVLVDNSVVVEGVGRVIEGEYMEETLAPSEWHEWRPVWIAVG